MPDRIPSSGPRIGVVDDDASMCQAVARLLQAAGFRPTTFGSAEAYLEAPKDGELDCLVLDIHLPGLSGLDLQQMIARAARRLPVILITAHDEPETRDQARQSGCIAYLRKPFPGQHLLQAITNALRRHPATGEQQ